MNEQIEELLPFYVLGALTDEETAVVEAYLAANPEARQRLEALAEPAAFLPHDAPPVVPSTQTKSQLMARVRQSQAVAAKGKTAVSPPLPPTFWQQLTAWWHGLRQSSLLPTFAVGSMALAAVLLFWLFSLRGQMQAQQDKIATLEAAVINREATIMSLGATLAERDALVQTLQNDLAGQTDAVATLNDAVAALQRQVADYDTVLAQLTQPETQLVAISSEQGEATGQLLFTGDSQTAVFVLADLAPLAENQDYQAWLIDDSGAHSAGLLTVTADGQAVLSVAAEQSIASLTAVGISLEPAGGSEQPTTVIMLGFLNPASST